MKAIDLFAGAGGFSTGATLAGCNVVWAANHWQSAVEIHAANHPGAQHVCQDLHQANWAAVPADDILLASPCCQGHSKARGKASGNPQHDTSRSTAWAVVRPLANACVDRIRSTVTFALSTLEDLHCDLNPKAFHEPIKSSVPDPNSVDSVFIELADTCRFLSISPL